MDFNRLILIADATAAPMASLVSLDLVYTVAFGGLVLLAGYGLRRVVRPLAACNIPAPVIGGLLVALMSLAASASGRTLFHFDTTLQEPLMIAFFTTIGFGASVALLRKGGPQVAWFWIAATLVGGLQNILGAMVATALGQPSLLGVLCGSVTLTGGPATGLAFAPQFEAAGVEGAAVIAVAAAMLGIVSGGLLGGPIGTWLIRRYVLQPRRETAGNIAADFAEAAQATSTAAQVVEERLPEPIVDAPPGEDQEAFVLLKSLTLLLVAMWAGSWISGWLTAQGVTLPAYIGGMLVAAVLRNVDDATSRIGLSQRTLDDLGNVALALFLVLALMTLRLERLAGLALPLAVLVTVQVALTACCCWPVFLAMGRDYDAAVMASGFCGFMLGTTANAMANMTALTERYGAAPRAFLVVPMVGAFFLDFSNAMIITGCLMLLV
jgi:ESS family glutamate:Na+ symporter